MSAFNHITRARVKAQLEFFIVNLIEEHKENFLIESYFDHEDDIRLFHGAIVPPELPSIASFTKYFIDRIEGTFAECARYIALEYHADAKTGYEIKANVSSAAINEIERQVAIFEHAAEAKDVRPSFESMIQAVLDARREDEEQERTARADLYILTHSGEELFFEIKSPVPNKGQCLEVTQRLLRFHLLRGEVRPKVQSYFAMAYNPYGPHRSDYRWTYPKNYMPFDQAVVIADEFWTIVGGKSAYHELLEIYQEVGREKAKHIIDTLAFGF